MMEIDRKFVDCEKSGKPWTLCAEAIRGSTLHCLIVLSANLRWNGARIQHLAGTSSSLPPQHETAFCRTAQPIWCLPESAFEALPIAWRRESRSSPPVQHDPIQLYHCGEATTVGSLIDDHD